MPQLAPILMAVGATATVAGTAKTIQMQNKSAKLQEQQSKLTNRRSQIQAIREAQIKRAAAMASGAVQGGLDSSSLSGGMAALSSQLGSGLGYSSQVSGLSAGISKAESAANTWQGITQLGSGLYQYGQSRKEP